MKGHGVFSLLEGILPFEECHDSKIILLIKILIRTIVLHGAVYVVENFLIFLFSSIGLQVHSIFPLRPETRVGSDSIQKIQKIGKICDILAVKQEVNGTKEINITCIGMKVILPFYILDMTHISPQNKLGNIIVLIHSRIHNNPLIPLKVNDQRRGSSRSFNRI